MKIKNKKEEKGVFTVYSTGNKWARSPIPQTAQFGNYVITLRLYIPIWKIRFSVSSFSHCSSPPPTLCAVLLPFAFTSPCAAVLLPFAHHHRLHKSSRRSFPFILANAAAAPSPPFVHLAPPFVHLAAAFHLAPPFVWRGHSYWSSYLFLLKLLTLQILQIKLVTFKSCAPTFLVSHTLVQRIDSKP